MKKVFATLALLAAAPAAAEETPAASAAQDLTGFPDVKLDAMFRKLREKPGQPQCDVDLPLLAELRRRHPRNETYTVTFYSMGATCAAMAGDGAGAEDRLAKVERIVGTTRMTPFALSISARLQDGPESLKWLRASADNGVLPTLSWRLVAQASNPILRSTARPDYERFVYELATSDDFARLDPRVQARFANDAMRYAARTGNEAPIDGLLAYVREPSHYVQLLTMRDYENAWPAIERRVGAHLATVTQAYVDWTSKRLIDRPEDPELLQDYAQALKEARRYRELIDLGAGLLDDPKRVAPLAEAEAWALNTVVAGYDGLGRRAEGDRVFERLAALPAEEYPWVVNFIINRAARLARQGRWEEALPATALARDAAARYGTAYARATTGGDRVCVLRKLGQVEASDSELQALVARFEDAPADVAMALMCAGRDDEAAALIAALLRDPNKSPSLLIYLQDLDPAGEEDALPRARDLILAREDLRSEAFKQARLLPDNLRPGVTGS